MPWYLRCILSPSPFSTPSELPLYHFSLVFHLSPSSVPSTSSTGVSALCIYYIFVANPSPLPFSLYCLLDFSSHLPSPLQSLSSNISSARIAAPTYISTLGAFFYLDLSILLPVSLQICSKHVRPWCVECFKLVHHQSSLKPLTSPKKIKQILLIHKLDLTWLVIHLYFKHCPH